MPTCYDIAHGELPPGDTLRCGNRRDLPKKQRVHHWQDLGPDGRNSQRRLHRRHRARLPGMRRRPVPAGSTVNNLACEWREP